MKKIITQPDLSDNSPLHIEAKSAGDEHFRRWQRNVVDKYKDKSEEEIKTDLQATALPCAVLMSQIIGDFNFGTLIRAANNFNVKSIYYYGNKRYDKRGAQGTYIYSDVIFLPLLDDIKRLKRDYIFVGLENNIAGTIPLQSFQWDKRSILVLGEEGVGIPQSIIELLDFKVEIPSRGSVRSLNVASAASIALYDYYCKYV